MRISIFGLGYVGSVTAGCLASQGHDIWGVDSQPQKVEQFNLGEASIIEPRLDELLREAHAQRRLRATSNVAEAIAETEVSIICVGTPSKNTGALDMSHVLALTAQIVEALNRFEKPHTIVYRSTMLPGSTAELFRLYPASLVNDGRLEVLFYPEFLREGTAVDDFLEPALAVVGTRDGKPCRPELAPLLGPAVSVVPWATAEMIKYACNAFHATKVAFANEVGRLSKQVGVDSRVVMEMLCRDTRLNLSQYYLRPGNPFGGSCLPKDVRALEYFGRQKRLALPMLESLLPSNREHLQHLLQMVAESGQSEVVILGLSFKSGTDDLRESAMVEVSQNLMSHGYSVRIFDPQLNLARLVGSNRRVIDLKMPHLASLLREDLRTALGERGLVVAAQRCASIADLAGCLTPQHQILDVNGWPELRKLPVRYEGFCW